MQEKLLGAGGRQCLNHFWDSKQLRTLSSIGLQGNTSLTLNLKDQQPDPVSFPEGCMIIRQCWLSHLKIALRLYLCLLPSHFNLKQHWVVSKNLWRLKVKDWPGTSYFEFEPNVLSYRESQFLPSFLLLPLEGSWKYPSASLILSVALVPTFHMYSATTYYIRLQVLHGKMYASYLAYSNTEQMSVYLFKVGFFLLYWRQGYR